MERMDVSVCGFGDNVVDRYVDIKTMYPGGNAVNFAVYAKMCGAARTAYMGIFGNDDPAEHVIASLAEEGVETVKCEQLIGPNGASCNTVDETGDRIFLESNEGGIRGDSRYVLDRFDLEYLRQFDLVHSGNYCFTERELPKIKAAGIPVSFDFSDDSPWEYYEQVAPSVDYAFMSASELTEDETKERLQKVVALGPSFASATRGAWGCIAYDGERFYRQPSKPVPVMKDTMGAGDSFLTSFLVRHIALGKDGQHGSEAIEAALDFAAGFASQVCGLEGAWGHGKRYE
ncbi:MAG: PfkB family carbohydrate kinase [Atopobiaceae bacterium]|jgi:sugar/nucleoside kinase (ribokinase family)|nr:PfkB family carbohydrate kinase [Atopobiaceae bacterium]MCI2172639.1 PfkB family carbohydrate kinase [Atopobiaceae bacterium]MCI2206946.1 PfkB family carbohydrate kinase [Atopobiaceae bacterium]